MLLLPTYLDMNKGQNVDIEAPMQMAGVFNVSKGQLITFQKGVVINQSESVKNCLKFPNTTKANCYPPEV